MEGGSLHDHGFLGKLQLPFLAVGTYTLKVVKRGSKPLSKRISCFK